MKVNLNSLRDLSIFCVRMPRKSLSESGMCDLKFLFGLSERGKLDVIQFCREKGMISSEYECPDCGREMRLAEYKEGVDGYRWRCEWSKEGKRHVVNRSIRGGSWFERSKLGMDDILILTYGWVEKFTNGQLARMARVSSNTATDWCNFCREVCMGICLEESVSIGGEGTTVEIDESMFGILQIETENTATGMLGSTLILWTSRPLLFKNSLMNYSKDKSLFYTEKKNIFVIKKKEKEKKLTNWCT